MLPMSIRVAVLAESDSYLKWSVGTAAEISDVASTSLHVLRSPSSPSPAQQAAALAGTGWAGRTAQAVSPGRFVRIVRDARPDVVLLACTGPTISVLQRGLARLSHRPVLVAGIPGVALPALPKAWTRRSGIDLFLTHSERERDEYSRARDEARASGAVGLASLPYLRSAAAARVAQPPGTPTNEVVFATQAKVPVARADRERILIALAALASSRPELDVVVKTRGSAGEFHTHHESLHYSDLLDGLVDGGRLTTGQAKRVRFAGGSMADHLARASGFVTVSSTAALEAMAAGVPVLLLDEFGVGPELINESFVGSGVMGGLADLCEGGFRQPDPAWRSANYFHDQAQNTWIGLVDRLLAQARAGELPSIGRRIAVARIDLADRRRLARLRLTAVGTAVARNRARLRRRIAG
jgi:hypothetical protein